MSFRRFEMRPYRHVLSGMRLGYTDRSIARSGLMGRKKSGQFRQLALGHGKETHPEVTTILDFAPGDAAQVDFGSGPIIIDVFTGEVIKAWFFVTTMCFSPV